LQIARGAWHKAKSLTPMGFRTRRMLDESATATNSRQPLGQIKNAGEGRFVGVAKSDVMREPRTRKGVADCAIRVVRGTALASVSRADRSSPRSRSTLQRGQVDTGRQGKLTTGSALEHWIYVSGPYKRCSRCACGIAASAGLRSQSHAASKREWIGEECTQRT